MPAGGVSSPIVSASAITTPKWTSLMPNFCTIGIRIGVRIRMAGVWSMNSPTASQSSSSSRSSTVGLSVSAAEERRQFGRDAAADEHDAERRGEGDDQHHHRGVDECAADLGQQALPSHLAIDEHRNDQRIERRNGGGLGGGEDARIDAGQG